MFQNFCLYHLKLDFNGDKLSQILMARSLERILLARSFQIQAKQEYFFDEEISQIGFKSLKNLNLGSALEPESLRAC